MYVLYLIQVSFFADLVPLLVTSQPQNHLLIWYDIFIFFVTRE